VRLTECDSAMTGWDEQARWARWQARVGQLVLRAITEELQAGTGVDNLRSEYYGAVVGVVAPNTADKEEHTSWSDAVECGGEVVSVASKWRFVENGKVVGEGACS
jgi:hypothetical protein